MKLLSLRKKTIFRIMVVLFALFVATYLAVRFDGLNDNIFAADVALVLGNKVHKNGECSGRLKGRLQRAVDLYREGKCKVIIVSGGQDKKNGQDEATAMRAYLLKQNIPDKAIVMDPSGRNTRASAVFTAAYMREKGYASVLAVSQYFHITRSRLALKAEGIEKIGSAHANYFEGRRDFYSTCREVVGLVAYFLRIR